MITLVVQNTNYSSSLSFQVEVANSLDKKLDRLIPFLKARTGPAIVYVTLQKHAEDVANHLMPHGLEPMVYHAGLPSEQRIKVQMEFMESTAGIVVCTIAFGMGIDKGTEAFFRCIMWTWHLLILS